MLLPVLFWSLGLGLTQPEKVFDDGIDSGGDVVAGYVLRLGLAGTRLP